ncbi:MAG: hypothetical protein GWP91_24510 [Rhodobacterales bacterium]|nr:hypothetical protein [Rhodobacterales bacterium]
MNSNSPDRLVICLSDIEMGPGGLLDDFPHSAWLAELICAYNRPPFADLPVDLVFNGDTLDLLKTSIGGAHPLKVDAKIALAKLERVLAAHPAFPAGCRKFLSHQGAPRRIHFIVGNHDYELLFPEVQKRLREAIGHDHVIFPGFEVDFGDLHVEHGSQNDPMFQVDPKNVFVDHDGTAILAQSWGAQAVIDVALPMQHLFYDLDRLKPRRRALDLLPDVKNLIVGAYWGYYTGDWLRGLVGGQQMSAVSWQMLREVGWRFQSNNPNVKQGNAYREMITSGRYRCVVTGHVHQTEWWSWADRKVLHTGCMRDEYAIDANGLVSGRIPKTYAEVYLCGDRVVRSHLVEVDGPAPPEGHAPASVFDVLPRIRPILEQEHGMVALAHAKEADQSED